MESAFFTVADWVANPRSNSIRRKNRRSVLPPRLMDLLFYFAQHPMEVVSRQEIIDNCWDRDVVTDQAITQAIFELRKFLKDGRSAKEAPENGTKTRLSFIGAGSSADGGRIHCRNL